MNEEISRICKICLAVNLKIVVIKNKQLIALYKNLISAQFDFDLVDVGVEIGACYICYTQLLKILKFSEFAHTSGKRLQYLKDIGVEISKRSISFANERSQHNLSITVIPPISLQSTDKITEGTVLSYPAVNVKNEYIEHKYNTDDDCQKSNNYVVKHPRPTLQLATISLTQRPMQTDTFVETKTAQEDTLYKPIDEYFKSNPVNVNEEYNDLDHNIADDCQKPHYYNNMIEHSKPNLPLATISLTQRPMQTETFVGTKILENCTLNKPINEDFMSDPVNVTEGYVENEHNITDHFQKPHYYNNMNEHSTLNLPLIVPSLTQRSMRTETLGTNTIQEKCALNKPIQEDFMSDPRNVTEEFIELDHNTTDNCQKRNNYVIKHPYINNILTVQPSTNSQIKSSIRMETFTGTNNIQEYTLSKQITEDHVVSGEKHNEHNIGDNCEKSKACVNDHTLTMSPADSSSQSLKQTKPLVGTKRKNFNFNNLLKLKKGKTNASELKLENDIAVTNTPFERNDRELAVTKKINKTKKKIEELIQKLIEIHMEAMKKNKNVSSEEQPTWCDRSQLLLIQLIQQAGSEWAGSMLLAGRVFPLFPQGFSRVPSLTELIRMAGYKTNTGPSELYPKQRKDHKAVRSKKSPSVNNVCKKLSTSIDNQGHSVLFSQLTKFPLSNVLEMESKRDIQSFIPVTIILKDRLLTSKETGISESDGKQPSSTGNETNNEIKLNNAVSSSVPKETSSMNKSQEKIAVKFDNDNEIKQNNAIFFRTHQNASKSLQSTVSSFVLKETSNISKSQEQNVVNIENHGRISSIRIIKEQLKSTKTPKQALKDEKKTIAAPKETDSVLEAMLNKFSKFKKKLDSQNREYNNNFK